MASNKPVETPAYRDADVLRRAAKLITLTAAELHLSESDPDVVQIMLDICQQLGREANGDSEIEWTSLQNRT